MLAASREQLLERLAPDDVLLDVGGWADPLERADWVIDLMPYETRGLYEREGWAEPRERDPERYSSQTWLQFDICDRRPWPFEDGSVDFVTCAHTLEDVRDPIWVCSEMTRIARAGYVEVPSRLEEQSWGVTGEYVGWSHHRWLIEIDDARIEFVQKFHSIHANSRHHFPAGFLDRLSPEERVATLWWEDCFEFEERVLIGAEEANDYLEGFIQRELALRRRGLRRLFS
jgi:hypothetical protein